MCVCIWTQQCFCPTGLAGGTQVNSVRFTAKRARHDKQVLGEHSASHDIQVQLVIYKFSKRCCAVCTARERHFMELSINEMCCSTLLVLRWRSQGSIREWCCKAPEQCWRKAWQPPARACMHTPDRTCNKLLLSRHTNSFAKQNLPEAANVCALQCLITRPSVIPFVQTCAT